jgi:hypothetical protein
MCSEKYVCNEEWVQCTERVVVGSLGRIPDYVHKLRNRWLRKMGLLQIALSGVATCNLPR